MWTDEYTQKSFLTLTAHYITDDFKLKTNVLGTREFLLGKKTGTNIYSFCEEILRDFKIENKIATSVIVTDNGANVVAAFRNYKRLSCACHNLNLVMADVLEKGEIPELTDLIDASKKLVSYFKHSELNNRLSKSLKQHVKTRWNSLYIMLSSIIEMRQEIQQLLIERNELHKMSLINSNLLENLIEFLTPFKCCSENLSSELYPTIHEYVLWYKKLIKQCEANMSDSEVIIDLKRNTQEALNKRFHPSSLHYLGLFLNPPYKKLQFLSKEQRDHVISTVKAMLEDNTDIQQKSVDEEANPQIFEDSASTSKKTKRHVASTFDEFKDKTDEAASSHTEAIDAEIQLYVNKPIKHSSDDVLKFWETARDLPFLRSLSRQVLNIPASSATSERVFSVSGRILEERRTRLLGENLDKILFLNKNMN